MPSGNAGPSDRCAVGRGNGGTLGPMGAVCSVGAMGMCPERAGVGVGSMCVPGNTSVHVGAGAAAATAVVSALCAGAVSERAGGSESLACAGASGNDLACTDEVRVYRDEGGDEEPVVRDQFLQEDKLRLVKEVETDTRIVCFSAFTPFPLPFLAPPLLLFRILM